MKDTSHSKTAPPPKKKPRTGCKKPTSQPEPQQDPWSPIKVSHSEFLRDLECIGEMISLVLPVLKKRDEERGLRIKALVEEFETKDGEEALRLKSASDIKELIGHLQKMRKGDRMFRQGVITSIVSKFDEFLIDLLQVCYLQNPNWLSNPEKKISYKELLEIKSLETLKSEIVAKEIDSLMRGSHHAQIKFLDNNLKLGIEDGFPAWKQFLEITERRNLFIHTGGAVSPVYIENCQKWKISINDDIKEGINLGASDEYIQHAIDCFYELSVRVAQATMRRVFPSCFEDADKQLNNRSVDLLIEERWELAERIFEFALHIPKDLASKGEFKYYFLLNRCIALKFRGKAIDEFLHSIDWAPFHPKYHFAVAVLEDRFADAESLMKTQAVQSEITEEFFKTWPLLREFRKSVEFQRAFEDIFGKSYGDELLQEVEREIQEAQQAEIQQPLSADLFTSSSVISNPTP
jgi:hypothetical protein